MSLNRTDNTLHLTNHAKIERPYEAKRIEGERGNKTRLRVAAHKNRYKKENITAL